MGEDILSICFAAVWIYVKKLRSYAFATMECADGQSYQFRSGGGHFPSGPPYCKRD